MTDKKQPATRPYIVIGKTETDVTKGRVVEAQNPAQAMRHVAQDTLSCRPLNATEVIRLLTEYGIKPERARRDQDTLTLPGVPE